MKILLLLLLFSCNNSYNINVLDYGAIPDDGIDDTQAIKAAIRDARAMRIVFMPAGEYIISETLTLNPDNDFDGISLYGQESFNAPLTRITYTANSGSAINIQSGRGSVVKYLLIRGQNLFTYQRSKDADDYRSDSISTDYAAISIDADPGRPGSANTMISHCMIRNFNIGINVSAAGATQGDMLTVEHVIIESVAYGISIGFSQARAVSVSRCEFNRLHTVLDNITFGGQQGSMINFYDNMIANAYQILNYSTGTRGNTLFSGLYAESIGRIGYVIGGRNSTTMPIRDSTFKMNIGLYDETTHLLAQSPVLIDGCFLEEKSTVDIVFNNNRATVIRDTRIRSYIGKPNLIGDVITERVTLSDKYNEIEILDFHDF